MANQGENPVLDVPRLRLLLEKALVPHQWSLGGEALELPPLPGLVLRGSERVSLPLSEADLEKLQPMNLPSASPHVSVEASGQASPSIPPPLQSDTGTSSSNMEVAPISLAGGEHGVRIYEATQFAFEHPDWTSSLRKLLEKIGAKLCEGLNIEVQMHRLLVVRAQGAPYRLASDSHGAEFATLLIQLPSRLAGGAVALLRGGEVVTHDLGSSTGKAPFFAHYAAFFSDVECTLSPVHSGAQVLVECKLLWQAAGPPNSAAQPSARHFLLSSVLSHWNVLRHRKLLLLLREAYTSAQLRRGPSALTGPDATMLANLVAANDHLPPGKRLAIHVVLMRREVCTQGVARPPPVRRRERDYYDDYYGGRRHRYSDYDEDEDEDEDMGEEEEEEEESEEEAAAELVLEDGLSDAQIAARMHEHDVAAAAREQARADARVDWVVQRDNTRMVMCVDQEGREFAHTAALTVGPTTACIPALEWAESMVVQRERAAYLITAVYERAALVVWPESSLLGLLVAEGGVGLGAQVLSTTVATAVGPERVAQTQQCQQLLSQLMPSLRATDGAALQTVVTALCALSDPALLAPLLAVLPRVFGSDVVVATVGRLVAHFGIQAMEVHLAPMLAQMPSAVAVGLVELRCQHSLPTGEARHGYLRRSLDSVLPRMAADSGPLLLRLAVLCCGPGASDLALTRCILSRCVAAGGLCCREVVEMVRMAARCFGWPRIVDVIVQLLAAMRAEHLLLGLDTLDAMMENALPPPPGPAPMEVSGSGERHDPSANGDSTGPVAMVTDGQSSKETDAPISLAPVSQGAASGSGAAPAHGQVLSRDPPASSEPPRASPPADSGAADLPLLRIVSSHLLALLVPNVHAAQLRRLADIVLKLSDVTMAQDWLTAIAALGMDAGTAQAAILIIRQCGCAVLRDSIPSLFSLLAGAEDPAVAVLQMLLSECRAASGPLLLSLLKRVTAHCVTRNAMGPLQRLVAAVGATKDADLGGTYVREALLEPAARSSVIRASVLGVCTQVGWASLRETVTAMLDQAPDLRRESYHDILEAAKKADRAHHAQCCIMLSTKALRAVGPPSLQVTLDTASLVGLIQEVFIPLQQHRPSLLAEFVEHLRTRLPAAALASLCCEMRAKISPALLQSLPLVLILKKRLEALLSLIQTSAPVPWHLPTPAMLPRFGAEIEAFLRGPQMSLQLRGFTGIVEARRVSAQLRSVLPLTATESGSGARALVILTKSERVREEAERMFAQASARTEMQALVALMPQAEAAPAAAPTKLATPAARVKPPAPVSAQRPIVTSAAASVNVPSYGIRPSQPSPQLPYARMVAAAQSQAAAQRPLLQAPSVYPAHPSQPGGPRPSVAPAQSVSSVQPSPAPSAVEPSSKRPKHD